MRHSTRPDGTRIPGQETPKALVFSKWWLFFRKFYAASSIQPQNILKSPPKSYFTCSFEWCQNFSISSMGKSSISYFYFLKKCFYVFLAFIFFVNLSAVKVNSLFCRPWRGAHSHISLWKFGGHLTHYLLLFVFTNIATPLATLSPQMTSCLHL